MSALLNEAALRELVAEIVASVVARPEFVTARNVEEHIGVPRRDFLRHARAGAFPSWKDRRLVVAPYEYVRAFYLDRIRKPEPERATDNVIRIRRGRVVK